MSGRSIQNMNGKPLIYASFYDSGKPWVVSSWARHTSFETAERQMRRAMVGSHGSFGWAWIVDTETSEMREVIPSSRAAWKKAHGRMLAEGDTRHFRMNLSCCRKARPSERQHLETVRHFFYWATIRPQEAVERFPWLKELVAEAVLCGEVTA